MPCHRSRPFALVLVALTGGAAPATTPTGNGFLQQVRARFQQWDGDHDGTLSADEIERALADPANAGPAGAAAATLRRSFYSYSKFRPITLSHLTAAVDHDPSVTAEGQPKVPPYEAMYEADLKKIERTDRAVFATGLPRVETLGQGRLGDCFLLAGVGTVAACEPERMKGMVTPLPDGRVKVQFGGGQSVTVPAPTDGEIAVGADAYGSADDGVWGNLFEVAIGQVMLDRQRKPRYVTPYQLIGVGGTPNVPLGILTGHACTRVGCEDFQKAGRLSGAAREARLDAVRDALVAAFKAGRLVVGGTGGLKGGEAIVPGLYYDHSYGVLGYDRGSDRVTFWNPMGNAYRPKGAPGLNARVPDVARAVRVPVG